MQLKYLLFPIIVSCLTACSSMFGLAERKTDFDPNKSVALNLLNIPYQNRYQDLDPNNLPKNTVVAGASATTATLMGIANGMRDGLGGALLGFSLGASSNYYNPEAQVIAVMPLNMAKNKDEAKKKMDAIFKDVYNQVSQQYDFIVIKHYKPPLMNIGGIAEILKHHVYLEGNYPDNEVPDYCLGFYCRIGYLAHTVYKAPNSSSFLEGTQNGYWLFASYTYDTQNYVGMEFSGSNMSLSYKEQDVFMRWQRNVKLNKVAVAVSKLLPKWAFFFVNYEESVYNRPYVAWQGKEYFLDKPTTPSVLPE